jgi:mannose-6-phosphate isomerase-like protein (cupin superfamily)
MRTPASRRTVLAFPLPAAVSLVAIVAAVAVVAAQGVTPSCKMCPGTYIPKSEIDAYQKRAIAQKITDQQVRSIDVGKSHVGIGIVYRGRQTNPEASVAEHDLVSEVYHIIDGRATLALGPDLVGKERRPASLKTVRVQNGPGNGAKSMRNPVSYEIGPGDAVIIPAGTGHQFTRIDDHVEYLMVRIDPDKIVPTKSEVESQADLKTSGVETPEEAKAAGAKMAHLGKEYEPSCKMCPGTYIPQSEIAAYTKRAIANGLVDQQVRQVDIGKVNVGVALVHRGKLPAPAPRSVAEHHLVSEVYHVIDGSATLNLGPEIAGAVPRPATDITVRLLNGPGSNGESIRNGVSHNLSKGDVVVIPAGTGHQFTKIDDHITYLMVRIDPDKVTPAKTEADSKADLQTDGRATGAGRR